MELIDIGCNLTHDSFDADREDVIARALEAGVVHMVVTGASREGSEMARALAAGMPGTLSATAGVHPHRASTWDAEVAQVLRELAGC
ncbi:MAG: hydrolase TatD, partial [Gammaproteobacteria bacterium]|nr:hydrolase TatD [Gammaproteobacteria bacterium]